MAQIATVATITGKGTVFAVNEQGVSRQLKAGDVLQKGETIRTVGDVQVELRMDDGRPLAVAPNQTLRLDDNVTQSDQRPTAQDSAVIAPAGTADTVIQALERGTDLSTQLEATAAGLGGGAGADGGNTFVQLLRIVEGVDPLAYAYEYKAPDLLPDLDPEPGLAPATIVASITIDPITGDNILNADEAKQPFVTITGTVGGDVKVGDIVTLTINGKDYTGPVTVDANGKLVYSIPVETASLKADSTIDAKVSTTDAAGNTATATDNGAVQLEGVSIEISIASVDGASTTVNEAGLTSPADQSEINGGSFDIATNLGVAAVTIGGTSFTLAQLKALSDANPSAAIDTGEGWMRITGFVGSNGDKAGTISFTYELKAALDNVDDPATEKDEGASFLDSVAVSVTGIGGTVANASIGIDIVDDVPTVTVNAAAEGAITLTTQDAQTTGDTSDTASASFAAAFLAAAVPAYGADGAGSTVIGGYTLNVTDGAASGLLSQGESIVLSKNEAGEVVGSTTNGGAIFKLSVDSNGMVTLTQYSQIDHVGADNGAQIALAEGKVSLSATVTTTDHDGDTAAATVSADLGGNIRFDDDVPSISVTLTSPAADALVVDETTLGTNATANFADNFTSTPTNGADGATVASVYALSAVAGNSGLVDTASGQNVVLSLNAGVVEGRTATGGDLVFTVSVNASGTVTLDQIRAVVHNDSTDSDEAGASAVKLSADNLVTLTRTDTITDGDGDTASSSASINIGQALSFKDDGPTAVLATAPATAVKIALDETAAAATDVSATADFSAYFSEASTVYGTDGEGSISYAFKLAAAGDVASGMYALGTDGAQGEEIVLNIDEDGVITGSVDGGLDYFTLEINSETGVVTFTQLNNLWHDDSTDSDNEAATLAVADGELLIEQTVTDADGDTSSVTFDLGAADAFSINDDGPTAVLATAPATAVKIALDETAAAATDVSATADFSAYFSEASTVYGTDGAGSISYAFKLDEDGDVASGMYALGTDGAQGEEIVLNIDEDGVITGSADGVDYFTLTIDAETGEVTFAQLSNIWHDTTTDHDEPATLAVADGALLIEQTVTDADGDTSSVTFDLGAADAFSIEDDGPTAVLATAPATAVTIALDETAAAATDVSATADFSVYFSEASTVYGTDGAGSISYAFKLDEDGDVASGMYALDAEATDGKGDEIVLNIEGGVITGSVDGGLDYFTLEINSETGVVTFTQLNNLWHDDSTDSDNEAATLAVADGELLIEQTVTDADGDTSSVTFDLGAADAFSINDDGPTAVLATAPATAVKIALDETAAAATDVSATADFSAYFSEASTVYGTDGEGSISYAFKLAAAGDVASGMYALGTDGAQGEEIVLNIDEDGVITGSADGVDYFTLTIDAETGEVTFAQLSNIWHDTTTDHDEPATLAVADGALLIEQTVTDADGDTSSVTFDLGAADAFSIEDDGPTAVLATAPATAVTIALDETAAAATDVSATADFSVYFSEASTVYGTDGAGSISYAFKLDEDGDVASGMYALGTDGAQGEEIVLNIDEDGVITGSADGVDYFTLTIDAETGEVTFAQLSNIWHDTTTDHDEPATLAVADGALLIEQTVTDADGDTSSVTFDLGAADAFSIEDDGPTAVLATAPATAVTIALDETAAAATDVSATADFSVYFSEASTVYGTDGAGSISYAFKLDEDGDVASGMYALGTDGAQGEEIVLNIDEDGVITGSADGVDYFTLTIDAETGEVTFAQLSNIWHDTTTDHDEPATLAVADGALLIEQTVTDADGDTSSVTFDLGAADAFSIEDDGPTAVLATAPATAVTIALDETAAAATDVSATADFSVYFSEASTVYGTDGEGSISYAFKLAAAGDVASGMYALGTDGAQGEEIVLNIDEDGVITGSVDGGLDYFTLEINSETGVVTFTQLNNLWHDDSTDSDNEAATLAVADGELLIEQTVTDADGDTSSVTFDLGAADAFSINDDGPTAVLATAPATAVKIALDETAAAATDVSATADFSAYFSEASTVYGTDGEGSISYAFKLAAAGDVASGMYALGTDGAQGEEIVLNIDEDGVITGSVDGGLDYFTLEINSETGVVTFTQLNNLWHDDSTDSDNEAATLAVADGELLIEQTVTDADGDTSSVTFDLGAADAFSINDDGPTAVLATAPATAVKIALDETAAAATDVSATADFSAYFSEASTVYGTDGAGSISYAFKLDEDGDVASGMYALGTDGAQGEEIVLNIDEDGVITGSADGVDYFTLTIDAETGEVTFAQLSNIWHDTTTDHDEPATLAVADGALLIEQTVTDADGDTSSVTFDLGAADAFSIEDDGPTAVLATAPATAVTIALDETAAAATDVSATADFSVYFSEASTVYGTDGAGSISYAFKLDEDGDVASGMYALDAEATDGKGDEIVLNIEGGVITGSVDGGLDYFTLEINSETGVVTFTQLNNLWHDDSTDSDNEAATLAVADGELLIEQTVTDADGDTSSVTFDLGAADAFSINDDGPTAVLATAPATAVKIALDETAAAATDVSATADFSAYFSEASTVYGTDGEGSISYAFKLAAAGDVASGMYALGTDGAQGEEIVLNIDEDGVITGSADGVDYFTLTIDAETGEVTFAQLSNIWHDTTTDHDEPATLAVADGALLIEQTVTDADGDTSSVTFDLGAADAFSIEDDGPTAVLATAPATAVTIALDETAAAATDVSATADFSVYFSEASTVYGTDGAGSISYAFKLDEDGDVASGMYALGTDGAQGEEIVLNIDEDGVITGSADGVDYFTLTIDAETGEVTFAQLSNIWHDTTTDHDEPATLAVADGALLIEQTVTDADGDTSSVTFDLGAADAFSIEDDGPTAVLATAPATAVTIALDETAAAATDVSATADFSVYFSEASTVYGTDGAGSISYAFKLDEDGDVASGMYALDAEATDGKGDEIVLNIEGGVITGSAGGENYFTLAIDSETGVVTFTQLNNLWHDDSTDSDNEAATLAVADGELLIEQTVTDADGDTSSVTFDLGAADAFSINDDGPVFTSFSVDQVVELTSTLVGSTDEGSYVANSGTDGLGKYSIEYLSGAPEGLHFYQFETAGGGATLVATYSTLTNPTWDEALNGAYFKIEVNADETYTATMLSAQSSTMTGNVLLDASYADYLVTLNDGTTINAVRYNSSGALVDSNSGSGANSDKISVSSSGGGFAGFGVGNNTVNSKEGIVINFNDRTDVVAFALEQTSAGSGSATISWTTYDGETKIAEGSFVYNQGQTNGELITIDPNETFSSMEIHFVDVTGTYRLSDLRYGTEVPPLDQELQFQVGVSDADGDVAYQTITLDLNADPNVPQTIVGGSSVDVLEGSSLGDTLIGGAGNDTLTGGTGADVFKWSLGDQGTTGTPANDHVIDFSKADGDKLNLADLLTGHGNDLTQYLSFGSDGTHAVLNVSTAGTIATPDQKIVFDNLTLAQLQTAFSATDSADLIAKMKTNGNLITD